MAKEEKFLLVSLKESESKKLAQVLSNNTSRKIMEFLASVDSATESDIAKSLNLPISTVHYNLQQLIKSKIVDSKEYHYSEKGKEVNHYSLAKKYIIIAPSTEGIKTKLKSILPVAVVVVAAAALISLFARFFSARTFGAVKTAADAATLESAPVAEILPSAGLPAPVWFLLGGIAAMLVYVLIILIKRWKK